MERVKIDLEFVIKSSPTILYQYLTTPSGLVEWFCDDVNIKGSKLYSFFWDGEEFKAELTKKINGKLVKFKFLERAEEEYIHRGAARLHTGEHQVQYHPEGYGRVR